MKVLYGVTSQKRMLKALKDNKITIYSSNSIDQGAFVSTSKIQAEQYSGGKKVYEKTVPLDEVAWINGDEGQFASIKQDRASNKQPKGDDDKK